MLSSTKFYNWLFGVIMIGLVLFAGFVMYVSHVQSNQIDKQTECHLLPTQYLYYSQNDGAIVVNKPKTVTLTKNVVVKNFSGTDNETDLQNLVRIYLKSIKNLDQYQLQHHVSTQHNDNDSYNTFLPYMLMSGSKSAGTWALYGMATNADNDSTNYNVNLVLVKKSINH